MDHFKFIIGALIYLCMVQYSKGITTVSQKNSGNGKLETYCVTNNDSETLSWITPYDRSFYNLNGDDSNGITEFVPNYWLLEDSYQSYLGPVVDPRWQNFETFVSKNDQNVNKYLKQNLEIYFELTFSIIYDEDAEMSLYSYNNLKQTISFKNNILTSQICPDKTSVKYCVKYINIKENLERFSQYSKHSWNHYTIRYSKEIYTLLLNGISIAKGSIPNYGLNKIYMKSMKGAIWKLHIYEYYRTDYDVSNIIFLNDIQASNNKLCMSAYFYFDHELIIQIKQDKTTIKEITFTNEKKRWKFIKIVENVHDDNTPYIFWLKYKQQSDLLISHIKLNSDCDTNINKIYMEFHTNLMNQVSCESLNNPSTYITISDSIKTIGSNCSIDKFGNDCIKCKSVFNTDICEETLTCVETNKCYCQPGYYGKHCKPKCDNLKANVFGSNCNKKCGNCKDKAQCHHITGNCPNGCEIYFVEPFCNETDLPYLKEAPVAETPCYTTCNIKFNPDMYEGRNIPDSYKVEVFEAGNWKVIYDKNINDKYILLDKLNILTNYPLRIVLCHKDECMEGEFVPFLYLNTDCKDVEGSDVSENIKSRKISFNFKEIDDAEKCTGDQYTIKLFDEKNRYVYSNELKPNSNYMIQFWRNNQLVFKYDVTTDEEKPGPISELKIKSNITSIYLSWKPPDESVGKIVNYSITYTLQPMDDCKESLKHLTEPQKVYVETKFVEISNLRPHSTYVFEVQAFNKYAGEVKHIFENTNSRDIPNQDSYEIDNISLTSDTIRIFLKKNCERIESEVAFRLNLQCFDSWCENKIRTYLYNQKFLFDENLKAFTNYTILIEMATKFNFENTVAMQPMHVMTKPSIPNELRNVDVYSISDVGFSLVFDMPYPPTGILEEILINNENTTWDNCSIWKNRFCSTLNTKNCYTLTVTLRNMNVSDTKSYSILSNCQERDPDPPQNLQQTWDEDYNLILSWEHPFHMNGEFDKFIISYEDKNMNFTTQENLTYTHKINEEEICSSSNKLLTLKVSTKNKKYESKGSELTIKCPVAKPKLAAEPKKFKNNNHSLEILIPKFVNPATKSYIHIVVTQMKTVVVGNLCTPNKLNDSLKNGWIAIELTNDFEQKSIVVGNSSKTNAFSKYLNCYFENLLLDDSAMADINIILTNINSNEMRRNGYFIPANTTYTMTDLTGQNVNLVYLLLIPIVIILGIYIYKRKLIKNIQRPGMLISMHPTNWGILRQNPPEEEPKVQDIQNIPEIPRLNVEEYTKLVKISDFEQYVKSSIQNNELEKQYETMLNQLSNIDCEYGKLPKNKPKNRYANIVAYDHSRVVLKKIKDDECSDYINANYIHGLDTERAYIAAQAPKENTLVDFWRMVWEQKVTHIVMLTNVYEGVKKKSEKYWPDVGETTNYGLITITHCSFEVFPDYEERLFEIKFNNQNRKIVHLHYTTWPDHGVPMYPSSVVPFARTILKVPQNTSPILVHCSAGVGRTGTIILIDLCLRMVSQIGALDVFYHLKSLREQRSKMVDTPQQYKFAHLVLLECLVTPDTAFPCDENFETLISNIDIPYQMEYIESSAWYEEIIMNNRSSLKQHDPEKDRFPDIVPYKHGLIYLSPIVNSQSSNYINAVSVDSFMLLGRFIATQQPMPNTLADFWRLAYEYDIRVIVSLQELDLDDKTCCNFYPNENLEKITSDNYNIELSKIEICERYKLIWINMHFNKNQKQLVVIELEGWQFGEQCPPNPSTFLNICSETHRLIANSKQILVTCKDGASGCGLFIALSFMLEKIKFEQICDVCHAVRTIRRSRKQFVQTEEQFRFLYDMADRYLKEFEIYSNFATK